ncbi:myotubularin-related protein 14 isoform X3 [Oreochromis niloticus]|uniref:myotubularin-related protein 14 isoform X3 n=1 Tax=Oreochromis niloticus TaxID=8128 RepID=UPI0009050294|nr:myotubularin-related protein 14 isoform X3 [Oreochromis niloticus]
MTDTHLPTAGGFPAPGLLVRKSEEITDLIDLFSKTQYRAKEVTPRVEVIEKRCLHLFARDYKYSIIQNTNGEVCGHYPRQIVFLEYECLDVEKDRFESTVQISKLQDLVNRSKMARCRGRFVCPVILYNGKHICRSSTLAGWGELYGRTGYNYIFSGGSDDTWTESEEFPEDDGVVRNGDSHLFDKVRGYDIKLLRYLSVRYICDLMVENKKVKFGLNVTSSEKVDKAQRYADFTLLSVPYPGCEFFKDYKDRDYTAEGLVFNWNQDFVDAPLTIPRCFTHNLNIDWTQYQSWDLVQQTQNYLKLLLHIINSDGKMVNHHQTAVDFKDSLNRLLLFQCPTSNRICVDNQGTTMSKCSDDSGLLVHCISGWDRTPLFVSLLRLSLWADGAVHASLEPTEILYLTIAYDWFLFGHMLPDRLSKGEEIFFFCFNFLKHIVSEKFSTVKKQSFRRKNSHFKDGDFTVEELCQLKSRDRGSVTSLSSDFSLITEEMASGSSLTNDTVDLASSQPQASNWRKGTTSSSPMVVWNKQNPLDDRLSHTANDARSSSSSSNQSEHGDTRTGSSPLAVPGRRCSFPSERQARLEAVREAFLAAYSSTVGLKSSAPSPSGAISGLLEQFARGVGLRGSNAIV